MILIASMIKSVEKVFEEKILELGYSFSPQHGGFYILFDKNRKHFLDARLIISQPPNQLIYGSKNRIPIQAIGIFGFKQSLFDQSPDFHILMFQNNYNQRIDYIIIPNDELIKRLSLNSFVTEHPKSMRLVFWLMPDYSIYNATNISPEGEWFHLSKGIGGRMADGTDMDYTPFLNNWEQLNF